MQQLWRTLHDAGHDLIIISYIDPRGYSSPKTAADANDRAIAEMFESCKLPRPGRVFTVTDDKLPVLLREKPGLFIDDLERWSNPASANGITTLRLL